MLLVDEINRASPKTQAALLECMQENQVTVDGVSYPLERPFMVLATQNPIDYEGTYPLPEAQLDRFAMRISLGYPPLADEARMLAEQTSEPPLDSLRRCAAPTTCSRLTEAARESYVEDSLKRYVVALLRSTRAERPALRSARARAPGSRSCGSRRRGRSRTAVTTSLRRRQGGRARRSSRTG